MVLPACVAWMMQVPPETSVTVATDTVQTAVVCELKLTVRPEDAVALTVNGAVPKTRFESAPKLMVWDPGIFVSEKLAGVATPTTDAVTVYGPPAVPLAVNGADATPDPLVAIVMVTVELLNNPLAPLFGAVNVTFTPDTGLLPASVTVTAGALPNAVLIAALCGVVPAFAVTVLGVPTAPVVIAYVLSTNAVQPFEKFSTVSLWYPGVARSPACKVTLADVELFTVKLLGLKSQYVKNAPVVLKPVPVMFNVVTPALAGDDAGLIPVTVIGAVVPVTLKNAVPSNSLWIVGLTGLALPLRSPPQFMN